MTSFISLLSDQQADSEQQVNGYLIYLYIYIYLLCYEGVVERAAVESLSQ